jgi:Uma2 family endonuclease
VLVFLNGNPSEDRDTHWYCRKGGFGPDFLIEIVSPTDRSRDKIDFYSGIGVRELLLIDRDPWQLQLFRLTDGQLKSVVVATESNGAVVESQTVPIRLQLKSGEKRPAIVVSAAGGQSWIV